VSGPGVQLGVILIRQNDQGSPKEPSSKQWAPIFACSDRRHLLTDNELPFFETPIGVVDR
jgi:hypothetical protein